MRVISRVFRKEFKMLDYVEAAIIFFIFLVMAVNFMFWWPLAVYSYKFWFGG